MNSSVCTPNHCVNVVCTDASKTPYSEFLIHSTCDISTVLDSAFRIVNVALALVCFTFTLIVWARSWRALVAKQRVPRLLLLLIPVQYICMLSRPLAGLVWPHERAANNLGIALVTHMACSLAAGIAILFVHLQARLVERSSLGGKKKKIKKNSLSWMSRHSSIVFMAICVLQVVLFVVGAPLAYYYPTILRPAVAFWSVVTFVDLTVIPMYIILGLPIYLRIRRSVGDRHQRLAKHLLFSIMGCAAIGSFTGVVGLVAALRLMEQYDWVLIELCWFSASFFYVFIFILMMRKHKQATVVTSSEAVVSSSAPSGSASSSVIVVVVESM